MRKTWKWTKPSCVLPLKQGGSFFGLKTGSRGTPWNSKNAGPGGSEFTKCRFWPFKWHFAIFRGGSIFDTFFVAFCGFSFLLFLCFSVFLILSLFLFFWFWWFSHFLHFLIFDDFWSFFVCWHIFDHFLCQFYVPQWWHTFSLANLHSHYPPFW